MDFPNGNRLATTQEQVDSNAKALEEIAKKVDWKFLFKGYWFLSLQLIATIGLLIAVIRLALKI